MKVRFKFQKTGNLRFIGHLDVMRYFQKLNRRAKTDIAYSGGFSPHQIMSFATPLGTGLVSTAEYVDMELNDLHGTLQELVDRLNAVNVPDLRILDACILPEDAKNAMSLLAAADYEITFLKGEAVENPERYFTDLFRFYEAESVLAVKKTKNGEKEVDVKKQIRKMERRSDKLFLQVDTGSSSNLKPEFVLQVFTENTGRPYDPFEIAVERTELYGEEEGELKALIEYGLKES